MDSLLQAYEELADLISLTDVKVSSDLRDIFDMFAARLQRIIDVHAIGLFLYDAEYSPPFQGSTNLAFEQYIQDPDFAQKIEDVYLWVLERGKNVFFPSEIEPGLNDLYIPLTVFESKLGILHIITPTDPLNISRHQNIVLTIFATQISKSLQYLKALRQEREAYEQQLQQEKMNSLGYILAGVIHEINSPLTSIAGYSDLLLQQVGHLPKERTEVEKISQYGRVISRETERTLSIVKSLLKFVRRQDNDILKPLQFEALITDVLDLLQYEIKNKGIEVKSDFVSDLPWVMGDAVQLQQVIFNILSNGVQALSQQPIGTGSKQLYLRTWLDSSHIYFSVRDTGEGIRQEHLTKIFDPFFTTKFINEGTGLGLSLCFKIMNEHGGRIWAENADSGGAIFSLSLPYKLDVDMACTGSSKKKSGSEAQQKRVTHHILVIDDEVTILNLIETVLSPMPYHLTLVTSGEAACAALLHQKFDLILADMHLADIRGEELLSFVRTHCPESLEKLIFLTGAIGDTDISSFFSKHTLKHLYKPFYPKQLIGLVEDILGASQ